jgi:hypothetical protein
MDTPTTVLATPAATEPIAAALAIDCPTCGAYATDDCSELRRGDGRVYVQPHYARVIAAPEASPNAPAPTWCGTPGCEICNTSTPVLVKLRMDNLRTYLESEALKLAAATGRQRQASEVTREDEVIGIARGELFRPFSNFIVRPKRWASSVVHTQGCPGANVEWSVARVPVFEARELTQAEATNLAAISDAARTAARHEWLVRSSPGSVALDLKVQTHVGACKACRGAHVDHGVLVTIPWLDRTLSREYLL